MWQLPSYSLLLSQCNYLKITIVRIQFCVLFKYLFAGLELNDKAKLKNQNKTIPKPEDKTAFSNYW